MAQRPQGTRTEQAFTGLIDVIPLFDLCQFLLLNRRTGTLTIRRGEATIRIYFEEGMILDIMDEALRTGERILLGAVQWKSGTFSFDPTPSGVERRIMDSTEAILLEAARTIDELRASTGEDGDQPSQEMIFREKQIFAGELAEAFRDAIGTGQRAGSAHDSLQEILHEVASTQGTLLLRGQIGLLHGSGGTRSWRTPLRAEDLLERLNLPQPPGGETRNHRFERGGTWFHVRSRGFEGETQVYLSYLSSDLPAPESIGLDARALEPLLEREAGLILWTGLPRGNRSTALASWLASGNPARSGVTLWLEESPRVAWEALDGLHYHVGDPHGAEGPSPLLEWRPELLVVDSVRIPSTARLALGLAEAGIPTIAVATGLTIPEAIGDFLHSLVRCGVREPGVRLARSFTGWVGLVPLVEPEEGQRPLLAAQIVSPDAALTAILARGGSEADLTSWAAQHKPDRSLREEVERLEREGRCDPSVRARLRSDFPAFGL